MLDSQGAMMRDPAFTQTMQIGIVVRDLDATMRKYLDEYGIVVEDLRIQPARSARIWAAGQAFLALGGRYGRPVAFTMPARATNLNRHGAAVQLNRELLVGSVVLVRNKRGTQVSARLVAQWDRLLIFSRTSLSFRLSIDGTWEQA